MVYKSRCSDLYYELGGRLGNLNGRTCIRLIYKGNKNDYALPYKDQWISQKELVRFIKMELYHGL